MKNNKGITLIALVITIIVMLILVTVTIQVATNGNLFTHAGNAAKETKRAAAEENALAGGTVGDKTIEEIVAEQTGAETTAPEVTLITFSIDSADYTAVSGDTWAKWVDSDYNSGDEFIILNNYVHSTRNNADVVLSLVPVSPEDTIQATTYGTQR